jgi:alkaline phosphatase D
MLEGDRTMLGATQEAWLEGGLRSSEAIWNVVAQQTVFSATPVRLLGDDELVNNDQWDGYPAARQRLIDVFAEPGVSNPLVVTGRVLTDYSDPNSEVVAHELVGTSISSTFPEGLAPLFNTVAGQLPWVEYVNAIQRGYVTVTLTPAQATGQWQVVDTVDEPVSAVSTDFTWTIPATKETL